MEEKIKKKSLKKIKIFGGGKREDLMKQKQELKERYDRISDQCAKRGEQDDSTTMLLRHIQGDMDKIEFELKPPAEQEKILAQKSAKSFAFKTQQEARQAQRAKEEEDRKLKEKLEQQRLRNLTIKETSSHEKESVNDWKLENEANLKNVMFVQSELDRLRTRHEALTGHEQPKGATVGYHVWYKSMVDLLRSHGGL